MRASCEITSLDRSFIVQRSDFFAQFWSLDWHFDKVKEECFKQKRFLLQKSLHTKSSNVEFTCFASKKQALGGLGESKHVGEK